MLSKDKKTSFHNISASILVQLYLSHARYSNVNLSKIGQLLNYESQSDSSVQMHFSLSSRGAERRSTAVRTPLGAKQVTTAEGQIAANFVTRRSFVTARPGI